MRNDIFHLLDLFIFWYSGVPCLLELSPDLWHHLQMSFYVKISPFLIGCQSDCIRALSTAIWIYFSQLLVNICNDLALKVIFWGTGYRNFDIWIWRNAVQPIIVFGYFSGVVLSFVLFFEGYQIILLHCSDSSRYHAPCSNPGTSEFFLGSLGLWTWGTENFWALQP